MAYGTPTDPVAGTVITVAYAVTNLLDPIRALRSFTGGSDPPGSGYVVTSDSTSATSWKNGSSAIAGVLGYTPANKAGDTFTGMLQLASGQRIRLLETSQPSWDIIPSGGQLFIASTSVAGSLLLSATAGFLHDGTTYRQILIAGTNAVVAGDIAAGAVGASELADNAVDTAAIVDSNVTTAKIADANVTAVKLAADSVTEAKLDAVDSPADNDVLTYRSGSGRFEWQALAALSNSVPSGLVAMFRTAAAIAAGWTRETDLDGRIPVGAGTTFTVTYVEATNYGSSWSHLHTGPSHQHGSSGLGVAGSTGGMNDSGDPVQAGGGVNVGSHTHDQGSLDVTGSSDAGGTGNTGSTAWVIPSRAYVFAIKS